MFTSLSLFLYVLLYERLVDTCFGCLCQVLLIFFVFYIEAIEVAKYRNSIFLEVVLH